MTWTMESGSSTQEASWELSVYFALSRPTKPFNPVVGETFEMVNHYRITYIGEQVSHHPPIDAEHAENEHFIIHDITSNLRTKLLENSLDILAPELILLSKEMV
ncbi:hypothetical protein MKX03_018760 [Papaver bracteatum]|nr:hypothetical protein MKX03_018760 [Papaver bracteatum]